MNWIFTNLLKYSLRHAKAVLLVATVLSAISAVFTVRLYSTLTPDFEELLPETARSVRDIREYQNRVPASDYIAILVFNDAQKNAPAFVEALTAKLGELPKTELERIEYNVRDVKKYFEQRQAFYLSLDQLEEVKVYVQDRIEYEKRKNSTLGLYDESEIIEPTSPFERFEKEMASLPQFPGGYFADKNEEVYAILAYLPTTGSKLSLAKMLNEKVMTMVGELQSEPSYAGLKVRYTGGARDLLEEHSSLMSDLGLATAITLSFVALLIWFFLKSLPAIFILSTSLIMGTLWAFGISYFIVGHLNANSAFLSAIIIGNGVNYGLVLIAAALGHLRERRTVLSALVRSSRSTGKATLVASLAAALSYSSLTFTEFRGFQQFGIIAFIGMITCWLSAYTVAPALAVAMRKTLQKERLSPTFFRYSLGRLVQFADRQWSRQIIWGSMVLCVLAIVIPFFYTGTIIESDMSNLRDKTSETVGSGYHSKFLHKIFEGYPHPMAVLSRNESDAKQIADKLKEVARTNSAAHVEKVVHLSEFVPTEQEAKREKVREIRKILKKKYIKRLPKDEKERVTNFFAAIKVPDVTVNNLPPFVKDRFRETDGKLGTIVLVEPPTTGEIRFYEGLRGFVESVREAADSVYQGTPVAGQLAVSADMSKSILRDGPFATMLSLAFVVALIFLLFRDFFSTFFVMISLIFGGVWLFGMIFAFDWKINFVNFIALPITFGISVDYCVNIYQRYLNARIQDRSKELQAAINVVTVTSGTTIIGYGSLLLAGNRAIQSFGNIAVWGELTCLLAAIVTLPALIYLRNKKVLRESE